MSGDYDISTLILELNKLQDKSVTPLLRDENDGEFYVLRHDIFVDEDGDVIIPIEHL